MELIRGKVLYMCVKVGLELFIQISRRKKKKEWEKGLFQACMGVLWDEDGERVQKLLL